MSHKKTLTLGLGLLTTCALLASCTAPTGSPTWPEASTASPAMLPAEARIFSPTELTPTPFDRTPAYGSLQPNHAGADVNVPHILHRGRLVVGVAQSLYRLGYRDPDTSELIGFEVDLAREIARDIFGDPNKVEFRYVESRHRAEALRSGDVDLVLRTMTITAPRQEALEFSIPYLHVQERLLTPTTSPVRSAADLADKTVCASQDFPPAAVFATLNPKRVLETRTWTDCLMALQQGQADAVYSDDSILSGLAAQDPDTHLVGPSIGEGYYGIAIAPPGALLDATAAASAKEKNDDRHRAEGLAKQVNDTLERLKSTGKLKELYQEWLAPYLGPAKALSAEYRNEAQSAELDAEREKYNERQGTDPSAQQAGERR